MKSLQVQLKALKTIQRKTPLGWTWFFDDSTGTICASKGNDTCRMFIPHPDMADSNGHPTPACRNDALLIVAALNNLPKLVGALERVINLVEQLDEVAGKRQRAAHRARLAERYDLFEVHRQSVGRVKAIQQAFIHEIKEAFTANPEPAVRISDYYQGNITDENGS